MEGSEQCLTAAACPGMNCRKTSSRQRGGAQAREIGKQKRTQSGMQV